MMEVRISDFAPWETPSRTALSGMTVLCMSMVHGFA